MARTMHTRTMYDVERRYIGDKGEDRWEFLRGFVTVESAWNHLDRVALGPYNKGRALRVCRVTQVHETFKGHSVWRETEREVIIEMKGTTP